MNEPAAIYGTGPRRRLGVVKIEDLWWSNTESIWNEALRRYWDYVTPKNLDIEIEFDRFDIEAIREMDAARWND
jgi:hypothetical protein